MKVPTILRSPVVPAAAATLLVFVLGAITTPRFLTGQNMENLALQTSIVAIVAIGSGLTILSGEIDLSPGSQVSLLSMILATSLANFGWSVPAACVLVLVVGLVLGAVNGVLVTWGRVPSFVGTLGTLSVFAGMALLFNHGSPIFGLSSGLQEVFYGRFLRMPLPFLYTVALFLIAYLFLSYTVLGREIYAVGGNAVAASLSGLRPNRVRFLAFTFAGLAAGFGAILITARLASGSPNLGGGLELTAITAAVVGGISLSGGRGSIIGALLGAVTISSVQNILNLNAVPTTWQRIVLGVIIILAVSIDGWKNEFSLLARLRWGTKGAGPGTRVTQ